MPWCLATWCQSKVLCELNEKSELHLREVYNVQPHEYAAICCCSENRKGKKAIKMESIQLFILSEITTLNLCLCFCCEVLVKAVMLGAYMGIWEVIPLGLLLCIVLCCIEITCGSKSEFTIFTWYIQEVLWGIDFR